MRHIRMYDRGIEEIRFSVTGTKLFLRLRIGRTEPGLRKRLPVTGTKLFLKLRIVLWGGEDIARVKETASCNRS